MARATPRSPKRRAAYHHGDLRRALIRQATAILVHEGIEALTLREVARRVGVTAAAPYAHFPDKAALLAALAEDGFRLLVAAMRRAFVAAEADAVERLIALGVEYVRFAVDSPAYYRLMFGPEGPPIDAYPSLHEAAHAASGQVLTAIGDCQRTGRIRAGDPMELALFLWTFLHGLAVLIAGGRLTLPANVRGSSPVVLAYGRMQLRRLLEGLLIPRGSRPPRGARTVRSKPRRP